MVSNDTGSSFTTTISSFIYIIVNVPNFKCSYQSKFLQLNFLKRFLGGGFIKHMQGCFLLLMVLCHLLDFLVVYCQINCSSEWSWEIFLKWWKQENEFLQDVFGFTPKKKHLLDDEYRIWITDKVGSYQGLTLSSYVGCFECRFRISMLVQIWILFIYSQMLGNPIIYNGMWSPI